MHCWSLELGAGDLVASRGWGGGHKDVISNIQQILLSPQPPESCSPKKRHFEPSPEQTVDRLKNSEDIEAPSDSEVKHLQQQLDQVVAEDKTLKETVQRLSNNSDDSEIEQWESCLSLTKFE